MNELITDLGGELVSMFVPPDRWALTVMAWIKKPSSQRVWPEARAPPEMILFLITRRAINPMFDVTVELSMKAPMSMSKLADLG